MRTNFVRSPVAQWQSGRLWTDWTLVRAQLGERGRLPSRSTANVFCFSVAQWQSGRLLTDWTLVRAQPEKVCVGDGASDGDTRIA
jgi:hypothetical protein